jgi:hypothetical protein
MPAPLMQQFQGFLLGRLFFLTMTDTLQSKANWYGDSTLLKEEVVVIY